MKLHIRSDPHTGLGDFVPPETGAEAAILAGDIHGAMDRLYDDVLAFEESLDVRFDYLLHVGDFGIWPDPDRVDRATREGPAHAVARTRPRVCFFGHDHTRLDAEAGGVRCIGLNEVSMPGKEAPS